MTVMLVWMAAAALALAFGRWVLAPAEAQATSAAEPACAVPSPRAPLRTAAQTGGAVLALAIALECSLGVAAAAATAEGAQGLWFVADEPLAPAPAAAPGESLAATAWTPSAAFNDGWVL